LKTMSRCVGQVFCLQGNLPNDGLVAYSGLA
jgi:hypothetical protein